jgi:hypothetical protein
MNQLRCRAAKHLHVRQIKAISLFRGQTFGGRSAQKVKALCFSLHQAILDPVVDHFHEMTCAAGPQYT